MNRNRMLLNKIHKMQFVLFETRLFLDTHPKDTNAIRHYMYYQNRLDELTREYEKIYGPVTPRFADNNSRWAWCDGPWPWEREYNEEIQNHVDIR